MEGYEVVTPDEDTIGRVVERKGDYLIVEHGVLRKSRHAVPWSTVEIDDAEQRARTSLSKEFIETSPKLENGSLDEQAIAATTASAPTRRLLPPRAAASPSPPIPHARPSVTRALREWRLRRKSVPEFRRRCRGRARSSSTCGARGPTSRTSAPKPKPQSRAGNRPSPRHRRAFRARSGPHPRRA